MINKHRNRDLKKDETSYNTEMNMWTFKNVFLDIFSKLSD